MAKKKGRGKSGNKTKLGSVSLPKCISAKSLEQYLRCSEARKRTLAKLLHKSEQSIWPSDVDASQFYVHLIEYLELGDKRDEFNRIASKVEKKNRPIRFHLAITRQLHNKHASSPDFIERYKKFEGTKESAVDMLRWLSEEGSVSEAVHLAWAITPPKASDIEYLCDEVDLLAEPLAPYTRYLKEREELDREKQDGQNLSEARGSHKPTEETESESNISNLIDVLQNRAGSISLESLKDLDLAEVKGVIAELETAQQSILDTQASKNELDPLIRTIVDEFIASGMEEFRDVDLIALREEVPEDVDLAELKAMSVSLGQENQSVTKLTESMQEQVTAERVGEMAEAVHRRDTVRLDLLNKLKLDRLFVDAPSDEISDQATEKAEAKSEKSAQKDAQVDPQPASETISNPTPNVKEPGERVETDLEDVGEAEEESGFGEEVAPADDMSKEGIDQVVLQRALQLAGRGKSSSVYWLLWAHQALGGDVGISPAAIRCLSDAGQLTPGCLPGTELRRSLAEFAEEDLCRHEDEIIALAAVVPIALFAHSKPTWVYALANQLRSNVGDASLNDLFEVIVRSCLDQNVWISDRAISSVAVKSDRSDRLRLLQDRATAFRDQIPFFHFNFRPASEVFKDAFGEREDLGRLLLIIAEDRKKDRPWLQDYLEDLDSETLLDDLISGRRYRGRPIGAIQGAARNKMLHHIDQVREMASEWVHLSGEKIAEPDLEAQRRLASRIETLVPPVLDSLREQGFEDLTRRVALELASKSFARMLAVVKGKYSALDDGVTTTLALQSDCQLSSDLEPPAETDEEQLENLRDQLLRDGVATLVEAVTHCLGRHEYNRAKFLADSDDVSDDIREKVRESIEHGVSEIGNRLDQVESDVEDAYLLGLLDGNEDDDEQVNSGLTRPALMAGLTEARRLAGDLQDGAVVDLARAYESLNDVNSKIEQLKTLYNEDLVDELKVVLDRLSSGSTEEREDGEYLERVASQFQELGDNIALNELLSQAKEALARNERLPREASERNEQTKRFSELESGIAKHWGSLDRLASQIKRKDNIANVIFGDKDSQHCERAAAAMAGWAGLRNWHAGVQGNKRIVENLMSVLRFFNVPLSDNAERKVVLAVQNDLALASVPVSGRCFDSPIPAFGSEISRYLHVVIVRSKVTAREISRYIETEVPAGRSAVVFHIPPVRPTERKAFRTQSIDRQISALLVDFSIFLFAAGTRDPIVSVLELVLPSTWSAPYIMKGEKVAPEMFVGRDEEARQVLEMKGSSVFFGGRQLGKSALLRHVQGQYHNESKGMWIVYLDIDDLGNPPQTHEEMAKRLWGSIGRELIHVGFLNADDLPEPRRKEYVDSVQSAIRSRLDDRKNERLIVQLDESDDLLDLDSAHGFMLVTQLRQLMVSTDRRFKVVFAGLQSVQRFNNISNHPFAHLGSGIAITPLPPGAARDLVVEPMRALGYEFESPGLVLRILSQTNYHPGLVQIFCKRLLDRLYQKRLDPQGVSRIIESHDVAAIERQQEFMDEIRNRFDWTLDLDDRYKVLIYALVLSGDSAEPKEDLQFLRLGAEWWPTVFDGMERQAIRGLLDEMVGLGILFSETENEVRVYRLRSPNLLRLFGSRSEIEAELTRLIALDKPRKPNPANYRPCLQKKPVEYGPLSMEQASRLLDPSAKSSQPFQIRVVLGGEALGMSSVPGQVRFVLDSLKEYGEEWREFSVSPDDQAGDLERICGVLEEKLKPTSRKNLYTTLEFGCTAVAISPVEFVARLKSRLQKHCRKTSRGLVIVLLDEGSTWRWILSESVDELTEDGRVQELSLQRWSDGALAKALEDAGLRSKAKDHGEDLFQATDGLFDLCQTAIRSMQESDKKDWSLADFEELVAEHPAKNDLFRGICDADLREAVEVLADIADGEEINWVDGIDLLKDCADPPKEITESGAERLRRWLVATGLSSPIHGDTVRLTQFLSTD